MSSADYIHEAIDSLNEGKHSFMLVVPRVEEDELVEGDVKIDRAWAIESVEQLDLLKKHYDDAFEEAREMLLEEES